MITAKTKIPTKIISLILTHAFLAASLIYPEISSYHEYSNNCYYRLNIAHIPNGANLRKPLDSGSDYLRERMAIREDPKNRIRDIIRRNNIGFRSDKEMGLIIETFTDAFIPPDFLTKREGYFYILDDEKSLVKIIEQLKEIKGHNRVDYVSSIAVAFSNIIDTTESKELVIIILEGLFSKREHVIFPHILVTGTEEGDEYHFFAGMLNELLNIARKEQKTLAQYALNSVFRLSAFDANIYQKALVACNKESPAYSKQIKDVITTIFSNPDIGCKETRQAVYELLVEMDRQEGEVLIDSEQFKTEFLYKPFMRPLQEVLWEFEELFTPNLILDINVNDEELIDLADDNVQKFIRDNFIEIIPEGDRDALTRWNTQELLDSAKVRFEAVSSRVKIMISKSGRLYYVKESRDETSSQYERTLLVIHSLVKVIPDTGRYVVMEFSPDWKDLAHIKQQGVFGLIKDRVEAKIAKERIKLSDSDITVDDDPSNWLVKVEPGGNITVTAIDFEKLNYPPLASNNEIHKVSGKLASNVNIPRFKVRIREGSIEYTRRAMIKMAIAVAGYKGAQRIYHAFDPSDEVMKRHYRLVNAPIISRRYPDDRNQYRYEAWIINNLHGNKDMRLDPEDSKWLSGFLTDKRRHAIEFASMAFNIEPELLAAFLYEEEFNRQTHNKLKEFLKEGLSDLGSRHKDIEHLGTVGLGQIKVSHVLDEYALVVLYANRAYFLRLLTGSDREAFEEFIEFFEPWSESVGQALPGSIMAHLAEERGDIISLAKMEDINIFFTAFVIRGETFKIVKDNSEVIVIPSMASLADNSSTWSLSEEEFKVIPTVDLIKRYGEPFGNINYYHPLMRYFAVAQRYLGAAKNWSRGFAKTKLYVMFLASGIFKQRGPAGILLQNRQAGRNL